MRKRLFVRRPVVQVALIVLLLAVVAVVFTRAQDRAWATSSAATYSTLRASGAVTETYNTLRVYGGPDWPKPPGEPPGNMGAGSGVVTDENTGLLAEDQPYTEPLSVFNPQLPQAPRKDSITWNPLFMSETETRDENWQRGLYQKLVASGINVSEKVWFRMWYEPEHWDKDLNFSGALDRDDQGRPEAPVNPTPTNIDEWYPAVMQEFTYLLMELRPLADKAEPTYGEAGATSIVFPVGMREEDRFDPYGYGLTSLDGNFDGTPDIVHVGSEQTLQDRTKIKADFDGNGWYTDTLDIDTDDLSGNELAVFHLDTFEVPIGGYVQFLDHLVRLEAVFDTGVTVRVWYTGDREPTDLRWRFLNVGGMVLAGTAGSLQYIPPGEGNTGVPTGPFFVYLEGVDPEEGTALLMVGRALGATHSAMEDAPGSLDDRPGDPWFLKRFYVDGHEYNVVAIKTHGRNGFKFITIRTPIPKVPVTIEQHSVRLQHYLPVEDPLSVMPPYNYEHYIIEDVQAITEFVGDEDEDGVPDAADYIGKLVGPVPPILQRNVPLPYVGVGTYSPYSDEREMHLFYVEEDKNPQFLGELKEKYGEDRDETEFWYVEQWWTRPWQYTEFVLPDIRDDITEASSVWDPNGAEPDPDLYLLTSAFTAPQSEYLYWSQDETFPLRYNLFWDGLKWEHIATDTITSRLPGWQHRVKLWFDPAVESKTYKDEEGLRIFGMDRWVTTVPLGTFYPGPGDVLVKDPVNADFPVEIPPYTDSWDPFNPQLPQAPRKDSLTFNPAYMDKFRHGGEPLASLYSQISIEERDAREKVFFRMWYEPEYLDKILERNIDLVSGIITPTRVYTFPAVMQEFTYMYLDTLDQPSHAQPGNSQFAFPIGTAADELPAPDPGTGDLPSMTPDDPARFGYGLTTFDADFDGHYDIVTVHSEKTISETMGVWVDFDGDGGTPDQLDTDGLELTGDELVVFALEDIELGRKESAMFLDHMITLENISYAPGQPSSADIKFWYTGGGIHAIPGYSLHPDEIGTRTLSQKEVAVVSRTAVWVIPAGGNNQGSTDGAWFVYFNSWNTFTETALLTIGRALGATHSAIDDGAGRHDLEPGDPWYLKRFFVDGHEYNVVAIKTVPADVIDPGDEPYEFKYITIRTPVPKVNFVNNQDSQKLEGYYQDPAFVFGVDTSIISVMPPFNFNHTRVHDIQKLEEKAVPEGETEEQIVFANPEFYNDSCMGDLEGNVDPLLIQIVDEDKDEQFFGELKEKYWEYLDGEEIVEIWSTEQFHILPDKYTDLKLPAGQLYLLTSDWESDQSWLHLYGCDPTDGYFNQDQLSIWNSGIPGPNTSLPGLEPFRIADEGNPLRVKFWYDPEDSEDIYKNTWPPPQCTATADSNSPVCVGEAIELDGGPDGMDSYYWEGPDGWTSNEQNPTRPNATLAMAGTYTLTTTIGSCTAVATVDVTVNEKPTATASSNSPSNSPRCEGDTIELYGEPPGMDSYSWTGPDSFNSSEISPTIEGATLAMSGTYCLTVDKDGCTSDPDCTDVRVELCGDVAPYPDCNGEINAGDVTRLLNHVGDEDEYPLCCEEVLSATVASAVPAVLATTQNEVNLVPQHSSASFGNTRDVEIWVDATNFQSGQIKLTYGSTCADVTNWVANTADFPYATWNSDTPGEEWIIFIGVAPKTGDYLIGTLTIHCVSEEECTTALAFVEDGPKPSKLFDNQGSEIPATWEDGTFECSDDELTANAGSDKEICEGSSVVIGGSPTASGGTPPYTCSWSPTTGLDDHTKANPIASPASTTTYVVTVTDSEEYSDTDSVKVTVHANPTAGITPDPAEVCAGDDLQLHGNPSGGSETYTTHSWTGDTGPLSATDVENPIFNTTTPGTYDLTYTVTDSEGCEGSDSITVTVTGPPIYKLYLPLVAKNYPPCAATAGSNSPVCEGGTIELYGGALGMDSYSWTGPGGWISSAQNPTRPNATTAMAGTYSLTVTKDDCTDTATTYVTVNAKPAATASSNSPVNVGETIQLYGGPGGMASYSWTGPGGWISSDQNPTRPGATTAMAGTYSLTVTGSNGCTDTANAVVVVNAPQPSCEEKICNGGFETSECWTIGDTPRPAGYSTAEFRSGSWSMRLGITYMSDIESYSSVRQSVTIPGNAASATLSFWYYPLCEDTVAFDWQEVIIYDSSMSYPPLAWAMPKVCSDSQTWTHHTFDLMPYKGQTIYVYFNVYNDGQPPGVPHKTAMYLDDVSVQVCY